MGEKQAVNFRLSEDARELLEGLSRKHGISKTAVLELAIRRYALAEGVEVQPGPGAEAKD